MLVAENPSEWSHDHGRRQLIAISDDPMARLFTGPRGGRITTAVLRDATHWDEVVMKLGYGYLRRHDLRHTGLTWMADAGVPVHVLRKIAGHGSLTTTQSGTCTPISVRSWTRARRSAPIWEPARGPCGPQMVPKLFEKQSGRPDLNRRPLDPQSSALPNCATSRPPSRTL
jgi:integrase